MKSSDPMEMLPSRKSIFLEISIVYFVVMGLIAFCNYTHLPFLQKHLTLLAAILFLYVPILWVRVRKSSVKQDIGTFLPNRKDFVYYVLFSVTIFPLFVGIAYLVWRYHLNRLFSGFNLFFGTPKPIHFAIPPSFITEIFVTLLLIALPEEFFFREFLQGKLTLVLSKPAAVVLASLLFAIAHVITTQHFGIMLVFFPGLLFGYLRLKTGTLIASILFHASCDLLLHLVQVWFFGLGARI